jgi:Xaa-Pro dipeptidase
MTGPSDHKTDNARIRTPRSGSGSGGGPGYHATDPDRRRRAAFEPSEYQGRVRRLQEALGRRGLDGLLVHTPENLAYLTGYETSGYFEYQALVVPASGEPRLLVREVERGNVDEHTHLPGAYTWSDGSDPVLATAWLVQRMIEGGRIGLETHSWFVTADVAAELAAALANRRLLPAGRLVEQLRLIKGEREIGYVREAAELADVAMAAAIGTARLGATELDVAASAHAAQIRAGSEYPALPHYVSSGYRTELGHANWSSRRLGAGDLLKLELLGVRRRYHAGLTRPAFVGRPPRQLAAEVARCISVQDETFAMIEPGASVDRITRAARERSSSWRADGTPRIRLGYSMGIGFPPTAGEARTADFSEGSPVELAAGMVFHMLSVVRIGLVVSDTVLVTGGGHERLTTTERRLFEV